MKSFIEFTDRGVFFLKKVDERMVSTGSLRNRIPLNVGRYIENVSLAKELMTMIPEIIIPIKNTNKKNEIQSSTFEYLEPKNIPYFVVCNDFEAEGYYVFTKQDLLSDTAFKKIISKHKSKINKGTEKDIVEAFKLKLNKINEFNHKRCFNIEGISFSNTVFYNEENVLQSSYIEDNKEIEIKSYFRYFCEDMEACKKVLFEASKLLLICILENLDVEEYDNYIEINYGGNIEYYSKGTLLEELLTDYDKPYAKETIKNIITRCLNENV